MFKRENFHTLLKQEHPDLNSIIELITVGSRSIRVCGIKMGKHVSSGLFDTIGEDDDTVFTLLAKNRKLSGVITSLFDNAVTIIGRETDYLIDPAKSNRDLAVSIIINSLLKTNKHGNNALSYSIQNKDYDVLDKIAECGLLDNFQKYLQQIETLDIVNIVSTSVIKDYSNLFEFFFKILQNTQHQHHHIISEVIKEFPKKEITSNANTKNRLIRLCHYSSSYILESIDIERQEKQKISTLIEDSFEYNSKFQEHFPNISVNLKTYILDNLCTQYLNNDGTDFQTDSLTSLFSRLHDTNHTTDFIKEEIDMNTPNKSAITKDDLRDTSITDTFTFSLLSFIFGVFITACYFIKNRPQIDSSDDITDAAGNVADTATAAPPAPATTVTDALQDQLVERQPLGSNNFEEFFKVELSRMKELAQSGELIKKKFLPNTQREKMKTFADSVEYREDLKKQLTVMLQESYDKTKAFNKAQAYHEKYIKKIASIMKVTINDQHSESLDDLTTLNSNVATSVLSVSHNAADSSLNPGGDSETTPLLGNSPLITEEVSLITEEV